MIQNQILEASLSTLFKKTVLSASAMASVAFGQWFDSVFWFCTSYILSSFSWSAGSFVSPHFVLHFVESVLLSNSSCLLYQCNI